MASQRRGGFQGYDPRFPNSGQLPSVATQALQGSSAAEQVYPAAAVSYGYNPQAQPQFAPALQMLPQIFYHPQNGNLVSCDINGNNFYCDRYGNPLYRNQSIIYYDVVGNLITFNHNTQEFFICDQRGAPIIIDYSRLHTVQMAPVQNAVFQPQTLVQNTALQRPETRRRESETTKISRVMGGAKRTPPVPGTSTSPNRPQILAQPKQQEQPAQLAQPQIFFQPILPPINEEEKIPDISQLAIEDFGDLLLSISKAGISEIGSLIDDELEGDEDNKIKNRIDFAIKLLEELSKKKTDNRFKKDEEFKIISNLAKFVKNQIDGIVDDQKKAELLDKKSQFLLATIGAISKVKDVLRNYDYVDISEQERQNFADELIVEEVFEYELFEKNAQNDLLNFRKSYENSKKIRQLGVNLSSQELQKILDEAPLINPTNLLNEYLQKLLQTQKPDLQEVGKNIDLFVFYGASLNRDQSWQKDTKNPLELVAKSLQEKSSQKSNNVELFLAYKLLQNNADIFALDWESLNVVIYHLIRFYSRQLKELIVKNSNLAQIVIDRINPENASEKIKNILEFAQNYLARDNILHKKLKLLERPVVAQDLDESPSQVSKRLKRKITDGASLGKATAQFYQREENGCKISYLEKKSNIIEKISSDLLRIVSDKKFAVKGSYIARREVGPFEIVLKFDRNIGQNRLMNRGDLIIEKDRQNVNYGYFMGCLFMLGESDINSANFLVSAKTRKIVKIDNAGPINGFLEICLESNRKKGRDSSREKYRIFGSAQAKAFLYDLAGKKFEYGWDKYPKFSSDLNNVDKVAKNINDNFSKIDQNILEDIGWKIKSGDESAREKFCAFMEGALAVVDLAKDQKFLDEYFKKYDELGQDYKGQAEKFRQFLKENAEQFEKDFGGFIQYFQKELRGEERSKSTSTLQNKENIENLKQKIDENPHELKIDDIKNIVINYENYEFLETYVEALYEKMLAPEDFSKVFKNARPVIDFFMDNQKTKDFSRLFEKIFSEFDESNSSSANSEMSKFLVVCLSKFIPEKAILDNSSEEQKLKYSKIKECLTRPQGSVSGAVSVASADVGGRNP